MSFYTVIIVRLLKDNSIEGKEDNTTYPGVHSVYKNLSYCAIN